MNFNFYKLMNDDSVRFPSDKSEPADFSQFFLRQKFVLVVNY